MSDARSRLHMAHSKEDGPQRYPYDSPLYDHYDEAISLLQRSKKGGKPHIPTFAQRALQELKRLV